MRFIHRPLPVKTILLAAAVLLLVSSAALAQRFFFRGEGRDPDVHNVAYDGRFTFTRLKYATAPGGYWYQGLPSWAHGYPLSEENLMRIMNEITYLRAHVDGFNVFSLDDAELSKYPLSYITEAGWWTMTDKEGQALRAYVQKGGVVIFDDFRVPGDFGPGGGGWATFEANMKRVLPEARYFGLDLSMPIVHCFLELKSLDDF